MSECETCRAPTSTAEAFCPCGCGLMVCSRCATNIVTAQDRAGPRRTAQALDGAAPEGERDE